MEVHARLETERFCVELEVFSGRLLPAEWYYLTNNVPVSIFPIPTKTLPMFGHLISIPVKLQKRFFFISKITIQKTQLCFPGRNYIYLHIPNIVHNFCNMYYVLYVVEKSLSVTSLVMLRMSPFSTSSSFHCS